MINRIFCGDNLEIMKDLPSESIDLCYIDPPFFTSRNYEVIWNDGEELRQFGDRWVTENKNGSGRATKDINVFLEFMEPRIKEIHRLLKPTGTFFLHCDWHADSYLRILCDKIFDRDPNNIICWHKNGGIKSVSKKFPQKQDTILFYSKSDKYTFHILRRNTEDNALYKRWIKYSKDGENVLFEDFPRTDKVKFEVYSKRFKSQNGREPQEGDIIYAFEGAIIDSVWNDIPDIYRSNEKLDYPTQKPEALLERIIQATTNENFLVLDAFCGCGTTLAVAKRLKRNYIGIDVSPTACRLVANRIKEKLDSVIGIPLNAKEISNLNGYEFQNWIIREFGGFSGKRGADGGIDGVLGDCPIQVKKYKAGRNDLDQFSGALQRENTTEGIFIAINFSSDFKKEVARLKRENNVLIHAYSVSDILKKLHYEILDKKMPKRGLDKFSKLKED